MIVQILRVFAILCAAIIMGKIVAKLRLPAILGWLIAGVIFGPYLAEVVPLSVTQALWYQTFIKVAECFAGVMIGKEIIFRQLAKSGKQIIGITFVQSIFTFLFVSAVFALVFVIADIPVWLSPVFGGIALATAPAPALSIVNEYRTEGPVTRTLIPLAAIDDIIGVVVFFTVISIVGASGGAGGSASALAVLGMIVFPFVIGIAFGGLCSLAMRFLKNRCALFACLLGGLILSAGAGFAVDYFLYGKFTVNYLLMGMAFSGTLVNLVPAEKTEGAFALYQPLLNICLVVVIVNLGMPLDYRLIAGAGLYTLVYILSRAGGKIGGAFLGGKMTKAEPSVTKFLGFTLLPHSGVSLVFTGLAVSTLSGFAPDLANIVSGTIVAAAILNEIAAVILARCALGWAGELPDNRTGTKGDGNSPAPTDAAQGKDIAESEPPRAVDPVREIAMEGEPDERT